jgi:hypothetical protein
MANEATITQESFYKSLEKLEALAGTGAPPQAPAQPAVDPNVVAAITEKMEKGIALEPAEQELIKSQICTGPNSERTTWPGGTSSDVPGNGPGADKIKPDGTDYNERGMRKSIQEKVEKGIPLSAAELALLKSDFEKGDEIGKAQDDKDKEKEGYDFGKSLPQAVQDSEPLRKGIEVSQFLSEFAKAMGAGFEGVEARLDAKVQAVGQALFDQLTAFAAEQGEFNKSLAQGVVNIGHGVAGSIQQVQEVAEMPVGAPRTQQLQVLPGGQQQGQQFVQKSFGGQPGMENISKAMVADVMSDMIHKGEPGITPLEVIKYDTTGELRPDLQQRVMAKIQGAGR